MLVEKLRVRRLRREFASPELQRLLPPLVKLEWLYLYSLLFPSLQRFESKRLLHRVCNWFIVSLAAVAPLIASSYCLFLISLSVFSRLSRTLANSLYVFGVLYSV